MKLLTGYYYRNYVQGYATQWITLCFFDSDTAERSEQHYHPSRHD